jgi:steroid delta-isomerase-like uncharacterized protein
MRTAREVVEAFFDAFNQHDVDALVALYAEDAVNHQMPAAPLRGRGAIRKSFEDGFAAIPDMGCRVINVISDGEWGAAEWEGWGTHRAVGVAPRPYQMNGCGFFRVQGGVIVQQRGYWDSATMARQAGIAM